LKKDWFPKGLNRKSKEDITGISKAIEDVNRGIVYREDPRVIANEDLFKKLNKVIQNDSQTLSDSISRLNRLNLDGLGEFLALAF
jgi:hypothetical protein